ncbi:hypothetical protein M2163_000537 [Streptomyces sp. SAI-135]|jgi:hypothetical protein|uniref:type VII secretion system-associated protein n=1 Tax=unclassified Streptomyces TaxID=2593676 RepID=UPI00247E1655|nr:hypothetical protein [Streptomyces sp. SAI-090]MDH6554577.1 hypothetical protein [Streptomyces sp. SAI-041]MDH6613429.1 hypothetical protein [Streptomyces sp. SAI-135]
MSENTPEPPADRPVLDPPPPEEFIAAAKLAPNHWLFMIDPAWQGEHPPPEWAVLGQWRSDSEGEIVEWEDNEDYRPSPEAMGWPEPLDDVDRAIQLATTGYGPAEDVTAALARAELFVPVTADGELIGAATSDGAAVVLAYTAAPYLHALGPLRSEKVPIADLVDRIPDGHSLSLNSTGPVNMVMTTDGLAEALKEAAQEAEGEQDDAAANPQSEDDADLFPDEDVDDLPDSQEDVESKLLGTGEEREERPGRQERGDGATTAE